MTAKQALAKARLPGPVAERREAFRRLEEVEAAINIYRGLAQQNASSPTQPVAVPSSRSQPKITVAPVSSTLRHSAVVWCARVAWCVIEVVCLFVPIARWFWGSMRVVPIQQSSPRADAVPCGHPTATHK